MTEAQSLRARQTDDLTQKLFPFVRIPLAETLPLYFHLHMVLIIEEVPRRRSVGTLICKIPPLISAS
jgi:hypothetical protein